MCNLYSLTKGQAAIRDWFRARHDRTGNLPLFPGIFPDQLAPVVRTGTDGERELAMARWGMPGPAQYGGAPVTNIRNLASPHWQGWLGRRNRCLVLAWRRGSGARPSRAGTELLGFLTTEANAVVGSEFTPRPCRSSSRRPPRLIDGLRLTPLTLCRCSGRCPTMRSGSSRRARKRTGAPRFQFAPHSRIAPRLSRDQGDPVAPQRGLPPPRTQRSGSVSAQLTEAEANLLAELRRRGESYSDTVIHARAEGARLAVLI